MGRSSRFYPGQSSHAYELIHDLAGRTIDELQTFYALVGTSSAPTTIGWQRAYDEASNMTTIAAYTDASLSLGSVTGTLDHIDTRTFDAQNRTESIHRSLSGNPAAVSGDQFVDFNRDAVGRITRTQRIDDAASLIKSGLTTTTQYDLGRIAAIEHDYLFNRRSRYEVDWTASGDISRTDTFLSPGQVATSGALYSHDARGQLLLESTFQASGPVDNAYPTDASGNRTSDTVIARDNRLTSDADWNFTYDKEGNLTRKTSKTDTTTWYYTWDHRNRLLTAEEFGDSNPGSSNFRQGVRYVYDGFDQLIARYEILSHTAGSIGGLKALNHETYAHEGGQIGLHLVNDTPAVRYLWSDGVDQLLAEQTVANDAIDWTLTDHLGSVRGRVSSATGALAQHVNFDAFGNPLETQGTAPTAASVDLIFGYTGRPLDTATGQQNNHHRWYDRETGRWLSKDPIGFAAGDVNLYQYVGNQPTTKTDPNGLYEIDTHFYATYYIALAVGLGNHDTELVFRGMMGETPASQATVAAWACQYVDDYGPTGPFGSVRTREIFHFRGVIPYNGVREGNRDAAQISNDAITVGEIIPFGIGLHPLEDSFSHRGYGPRIGHLFAGHSPDYPYNDVEKALRMAKRVHTLMSRWQKEVNGKQCVTPFSEIESTLRKLFSLPGGTRIRADRWRWIIMDDFGVSYSSYPEYNSPKHPWNDPFEEAVQEIVE